MLQISDTLFKNSIPKLTYSSIVSYELFMDNGQRIDIVANYRKIKESTVFSHLLPIIAANIDEDSVIIDKMLDDKSYNRVLHYLSVHPHCEFLKDIYLSFDGEIPYDDIRLSIAKYIRFNDKVHKVLINKNYHYIINHPQTNRSRYYTRYEDDEVYYDDYDDNSSWSYEDSLAEACDGDNYAMLELEDRG